MVIQRHRRGSKRKRMILIYMNDTKDTVDDIYVRRRGTENNCKEDNGQEA